MVLACSLIIIAASFLLPSCGSSGDANRAVVGGGNSSGMLVAAGDNTVAKRFESLVEADKAWFTVRSSRSLSADGEGVGLSAYELIRDLGVRRCCW